MADVITRFRLETTQYDSKLRDAAKGLKEVVRVAELGGKDFKNFSDKAIENARALGQTASGATNAKDRLKDLVGSFNEAAKAYNNLSQAQQQSDFGKALSQSLEQLQQRIKQTKDELYSMGDAAEKVKSSGLFGEGGLTGMLQVAGGTLIAQGATALASSMKDAVSQGIELARQGEGIRVAFERLNNPNLLANLKEATHGTVSELELMKAAVKFDDFKLPVEELGTMLAFAQKKAKDTGQSIDYMVDSIVTGLGRKSLMILDNLGLSAAEIRERMKESGDMTKAVGEIIREQMAKAGDYVETAADRAARATAQAQDKMMELGRSAMPVAEEFNNAFNTIKVAGMQLINIVLVPIANMIDKIRQFKQSPQDFFENNVLPKTMTEVGSNVDDKGNYIRRPAQKGAAGFDWNKGTWKPGYSGAIYNSATGQTELPEITATGHIRTTTPRGGGRTGGTTSVPKELTEMQSNQQRINELTQEYVKISDQSTQEVIDRQEAIREEIRLLEERNSKLKLYQEQAQGRFMGGEVQVEGLTGPAFRGFAAADLSVPGLNVENGDKKKDEKPKQEKDMGEKLSTLASGLSTLTSGIESLGFEIPDGVKQFIGAIQGIASIIQGIQTVISVFQTTSMTANTAAIIANTAALTANSMSHVIPFMMANGGVAHAASGYSVPGNHFSGDMVPLMVNSGELILNRAQQGNLASQLTGGGLAGLQLEAVVRGEDLRFILNSNGRRTGRGEIVTTNFR